jgi:hypothetical protein
VPKEWNDLNLNFFRFCFKLCSDCKTHADCSFSSWKKMKRIQSSFEFCPAFKLKVSCVHSDLSQASPSLALRKIARQSLIHFNWKIVRVTFRYQRSERFWKILQQNWHKGDVNRNLKNQIESNENETLS